MNPSRTRSLPPLDQATPDDLNEALLHWEELDEPSLARLASHPQSATRLAALRRIESWLDHGGLRSPKAGGPFARNPAAAPCPPAEDLFDFAQASDKSEAIEAHLDQCSECTELVATLAGRPPSPLILSAGDQFRGEDLDADKPRVGLRPLGRRASWPPLVLAAGFAGLVLIPVLRGLSPWAPTDVFPTHALLRGSENASLLFPRGKLLAAPKGAEMHFELPEAQEASSYRIEVYGHGSGAFERGQKLSSVRSGSRFVFDEFRAPGTYRWRAFATVRGLESELGSTEFEVVEHPELASSLAKAFAARTSEGKLSLIRRLDGQGFQSDARRLAQSMPESAERDEYLRGPGR